MIELLEGRRLSDPQTIDKLDFIAKQVVNLYPSKVLAVIIDALDLYGVIARWPDAKQARANLLRLQEECLEFESANREALACGGYYGTGIKSFSAWLQGKIERDDNQPDPSVRDEHAVQLTTWHSAKGKEWPIVLVCGMDDDYAPRLPATRVLYDDFSDLGCILEKVRVEMSPDFEATETKENFLQELAADAEDSAARLLYVALTRAREKLILEWPSYQLKSPPRKNKSYWQLFVDKVGAVLTGTTMTLGDRGFDCRVQSAGKEPWELESPEKIAHLAPVGRRAIVPGVLQQSFTPEHQTPSSLHDDQAEIPFFRNVRYAEPLIAMQGLSATERGTLLHRCFEILLQRPEFEDQLQAVLGDAATSDECIAITAAVNAFRHYLQNEYPPVSLNCEEPFVRLDDQGTVITGTIDLLLETEDGFWLIDHKSDQIDETNLSAMTAWYYPQLQAYCEAVSDVYPDKAVKGIMINWTGLGMLTVIG